MLKLQNTSVMNFENAMRGARNPLNSHHLIDSYTALGNFVMGKNDLTLAKKLCKNGSDHRKFMRQILVSIDITAPLYWFKEFDTYKIATVSNSTSTMHMIHLKPFGLADFSSDEMSEDGIAALESMIELLEKRRVEFLATKSKKCWRDIIALLPSGYMQTRTITLNYETLINIYHSRKGHKLSEWKTFCDWIESLPYANPLIVNLGKEDIA